jgi:hypothetical protein
VEARFYALVQTGAWAHRDRVLPGGKVAGALLLSPTLCSAEVKGVGVYIYYSSVPRDKWSLVTTAWRVFRLRMEERPPIWRVAANIFNKQSRTAEMGGPPAWGLGEVLTTAHRKNVSCYEMFTQKASDLDTSIPSWQVIE